MPQSAVDLPVRLSGPELASLMRRYHVTIRELARRMDIPMTRIRYCRAHGMESWSVIRDWVEAITGADPGAVPRRLNG